MQSLGQIASMRVLAVDAIRGAERSSRGPGQQSRATPEREPHVLVHTDLARPGERRGGCAGGAQTVRSVSPRDRCRESW